MPPAGNPAVEGASEKWPPDPCLGVGAAAAVAGGRGAAVLAPRCYPSRREL